MTTVTMSEKSCRRRGAIMEKCLVLSLGLFLLAFLTSGSVDINAYQGSVQEPILEVVDIPETRQPVREPPPKRPSVIIETEEEELPPDVTIEPTEPGNTADAGPPPLPGEAEPPDEFWWAEEMPQLIHFAVPHYPDIARKVGLECVVFVSILVDENGKPGTVKIAKPCGNVGFNEAAEEAAWKCVFAPGTQNGTPVRVWVSLPFRFELRGPKR